MQISLITGSDGITRFLGAPSNSFLDSLPSSVSVVRTLSFPTEGSRSFWLRLHLFVRVVRTMFRCWNELRKGSRESCERLMNLTQKFRSATSYKPNLISFLTSLHKYTINANLYYQQRVLTSLINYHRIIYYSKKRRSI